MLMKCVLLFLTINISLSQTTNLRFIDNNYKEQDHNGFIPKACLNEFKSIASIIFDVLDANGVVEIIFNVIKGVVSHFPGLQASCRIPLPTIDTSKWSLDKFKENHCTERIMSFSQGFMRCISGNFFSCPGAIADLLRVAKCLRDVVVN